MTTRLEVLEDKVEELNVRFEEEKERIPKDIERRGRELGDMLEQLREELGNERRDRLNREGRIMRQIADHSDAISSSIELERSEREKIVTELRDRLKKSEEVRADSFRINGTRISEELTGLKESLNREVQERRLEDDEIVDALNRYAEHLQSSLQIMSD